METTNRLDLVQHEALVSETPLIESSQVPVRKDASRASRFSALSLRANFSWMFVGNVIYAACQWGMLVALAKLTTAGEVGRFALGLAITAPVIMFTNLQTREIQVTDARHEYALGDYLALRIVSTIIGVLIIFAIALVGDYRWETKLVVIIVGLSKAFEAMSDLFYGFIQEYSRMDRIAKGIIIKGILSLMAMVILLVLTNSVVWAVAGLAFVWAAVLLVYDIPNAVLVVTNATGAVPIPHQRRLGYLSGSIRPRWNLRTLLKLTRVGLPLGLMVLLISLYSNIPRYFLQSYASEVELGVFAALAYVMVAGNTITMALGRALMPRMAVYYSDRKAHAFNQLVLRALGIAVLLGASGVLVALIAGKTFLRLVYSPEYAEHADAFVWLMLAAGIRYVERFINDAFTAARYFAIQLPLAALVTATAAGTGIWLIPKYGIQGAADAVLISTVVKLVSSIVVLLYAIRKLHMNTTPLQSTASGAALSRGTEARLPFDAHAQSGDEAMASSRLYYVRQNALVPERPPWEIAVKKRSLPSMRTIVVLLLGLSLPLVSLVGRSPSFSRLSILDRVGIADVVALAYLALLLYSRELKLHKAVNVYLFALILGIAIGLVKAQYYMDEEGIRAVFVEGLAMTMGLLYLVAGYNIGRSLDLARILVIGLVAGIAWESVIVFHDWIFISNQWFPSDMLGRVTGTFRTSAQLGIFGLTSAGILLGLGWSLFMGRTRQAVILAGLVALTFTAAGSRRSAMISIAVWLVSYLLIGFGRLRSRDYWVSWAGVIILAIVAASNWEELKSSFTGQQLQDAISSLLSLGSTFIEQQAVDVWNHIGEWFPMGLGIGRGYTISITEIHNAHLALLVETGVLGLLGFYLLIFGPIFRKWPVELGERAQLMRVLVVSFVLASIVMMAHNRLFRDRSFMIFIGLASTLYLTLPENDASSEVPAQGLKSPVAPRHGREQ